MPKGSGFLHMEWRGPALHVPSCPSPLLSSPVPSCPSPPGAGGIRELMAALGAGLAAVHSKARSEHIFNVFISLQLPARLLWGETGTKRHQEAPRGTKRHQEANGAGTAPLCSRGGASASPGDTARGGRGDRVLPKAAISPHQLPRAARDRKGSAEGQGEGGDGSWWQGLSPSPGRGPGSASGKGGGWIQSLSFTWAGVQPRNSRPKTRSHERKKIARRRIIHPYFLVLCGCRAGGASHGRGRSAPLRPGWSRRLPGARAQPRGSRGGPGFDPGHRSEGQREPSTSLPSPPRAGQRCCPRLSPAPSPAHLDPPQVSVFPNIPHLPPWHSATPSRGLCRPFPQGLRHGPGS